MKRNQIDDVYVEFIAETKAESDAIMAYVALFPDRVESNIDAGFEGETMVEIRLDNEQLLKAIIDNELVIE